MVDWSGVRVRVGALAGNARAHRLFGANGHRFQLCAPLSRTELYGIFPLAKVNGSWSWEGDGAELTDLGRLAEPFPRAGADPQALAALLAESPGDEAVADDEYDYAPYEAWDKRWENLLWNPDRTVGAICVCHEGCGYRYWLAKQETAVHRA